MRTPLGEVSVLNVLGNAVVFSLILWWIAQVLTAIEWLAGVFR